MTRPLRDVWADTLIELAAGNPDLLVLDGDLATSTRADRFARVYPDRFVQMGIAEQGMVGTAVGLASVGFVPWLSSFAVFFTHRAVDQVRMSVARRTPTSRSARPAGLQTGFTGKTHMDIEDLAIMRAMPGMTVLAPGDATECAAMVRWATAIAGPVYLRVGREGGPDLFDAGYRFEPGQVIRLRDGGDVALVGTGQQSARLLDAADLLAGRGIAAAVVHVPSVKPLDEAGLVDAVGDAPLVVTAEEHSVRGGLGGLVAETSRTGRRVGWCGSGSRTRGANRPPTPGSSTATGSRPGGSRTGSSRSIRRPGSDHMAIEVAAMTGFSLKDPSDIGVAVLGAGRIGQTHVRTMAAIPNAHVVVVADPDPTAAAAGRVLARARRASDDPLEAIHDADVEAVVILTPTDTHATLIEAALRAGKAVWSEKPIAQDMAETSRIVDLWRETGIPVQLGFMRRFDPGYARAKQLIAGGELGRIEQFRAYSRDTFPPPVEYLLSCGGSFLTCPHDLDLARFLVGEVEEVHAWRASCSTTASRRPTTGTPR
jgi:transketolase